MALLYDDIHGGIRRVRAAAAASRRLRHARPDSDWDFAYPAAADLADLARASALLRFRVAREAVVLLERDAGTSDRFWYDVVHTWSIRGAASCPSWLPRT